MYICTNIYKYVYIYMKRNPWCRSWAWSSDDDDDDSPPNRSEPRATHSPYLLLTNACRWRRLGPGGLVFKAHRRVYHSTLSSRVIQKKKTTWARRRKPASVRPPTLNPKLGACPPEGKPQTLYPLEAGDGCMVKPRPYILNY